jgi:hypothetical protein
LMRVAISAALLAFAALVATCPAAAQDRGPTEAESLFRQGREAYNSGDTHTACGLFARSLAMERAAGPLINLAQCDELSRLWASAWKHYDDARKLMPERDARIAAVEAKKSAIEPRVPRIVIRPVFGNVQGVRITLDGVEMAPGLAGQPIMVDPGDHLVVVIAPDHQPREFKASVSEAETKVLSVALGPLEASAAKPTANGSQRASDVLAQQPEKSSPTLGYVIGAIGVAGVLGGSVSEIVLLARHSEMDADKGHVLENVDRVLWAVGVVGVGVGGYLVLTSGKAAKPSAAVGGVALPGGGAASIRGTF